MPPAPSRIVRALSLLAFLSAAGCGREAPYFAPPPPGTGRLAVTSTPPGAAIVLDGQATGRTTPGTLESLAPGTYQVRVELAGYAALPAARDIDIAAGQTATADFLLEAIAAPPTRIVLLEAFSNVSCTGCPEMATMLDGVMHTDGYGLDRLLLIKYSANWPQVTDPHYQANPAANSARMTYYQTYLMSGIPTLVMDGALAGASGQPPGAAQLRDLLDDRLALAPAFAIAVAAEVAGAQIEVTVTLTAGELVENSFAVLNVALVENPIVYAAPPGNQGETEFHWVMRDFQRLLPDPLPLVADEPAVRSGLLTPPASAQLAHLHVVAFVQDNRTREVLQAGFGAVGSGAAPPRLPPGKGRP